MRDARRQRGSVLLLAVGLLTILAMLGSTLLITSYLDARQSEAMASKAQADPIAAGILAQVKAALREDLHIGGGGPYDNPGGGPAAWRKYIDYPSQDVDAHLASHWSVRLTDPGPDQDTWPHVTNLTGAAAADVERVPFDSNDHADTDGDKLADALLYDTTVTNAKGQRYYAAVRVEDMSGLLNVNTAADPEGINPPPPTYPTKIDLAGFLTATRYDEIHNQLNGRCSGPGPDWEGLFVNGTKNFFSPAAVSYRPFAIGEEMYFRWLGKGQLAEAGRLGPIFNNPSPAPASICRQLTTFNCSRTLVRDPDTSGADDKFARQFWLEFDNTPPGISDFFKTDADGEAERNLIYQKVKGMLDELGIGANATDQSEMAAHFVANMWAYADIDANLKATDHWRFDPPGEDFRVFGLRQDLVITEAYARNIQDSGGRLAPMDDWVYGCAIELMNPTPNTINLNEYKLIVMKSGPMSSAECDLAPGESIPAGQKLVVHNFQEGPKNDLSRSEFFGAATGNWTYNVNLDFTGAQYVRIKIAREVGGYLVPIDEVWAPADLDYSVADPKFDADQEADSRRDDNQLDRAKYNVAAYEKYPTGHELGKDNGLNDSDLSGSAKFSVPIEHNPNGTIEDLGELLKIYLTGPYDENKNNSNTFYRDLESFPRRLALKRNPGDGVLTDGPARGRFDPHPDNINYMNYGAGVYPDVPAAAMLGEFFTLVPPDDMRSDEPRRVYGRVNINTATMEVLMQLPWPDPLPNSTPLNPARLREIADYIIAYRDKRRTYDNLHGYTPDRSGVNGANIAGLRRLTDSNINGFLTPGEIAIPLADYANKLMGWEDYTETTDRPRIRQLLQAKDYLAQRDSLYRAVSNLITVNSDTYAVNIRVDLYDIDKAPPAEEPAQSWYYLAVIDRSNCRDSGDIPAVLLFSEIK